MLVRLMKNKQQANHPHAMTSNVIIIMFINLVKHFAQLYFYR